MRSIADVEAFLAELEQITTLLQTMAAFRIDDCWIGAGVIRNAVWDHLHGYPIGPVAASDVDVIYFDRAHATRDRDISLEQELSRRHPAIPWSVHNQARMHSRNGDAPYENCEDALRHWPETATAIAARLHVGRVQVIAPLGIDDLLSLIVRPGPAFVHKMQVYRTRLASKDWRVRWPKLKFVDQ